MEALDPADFTAAHARHLLRRTVMGPTFDECTQATSRGLTATLDTLLQPHVVSTENVDFMLGTDVVSHMTPYERPEYRLFFTEKTSRYNDTIQWWYESIVRSPMSIQERMVVFWHSLMPVSFNGSHYAEHVLDYLGLIRTNALGDVTKLMTEVSMSLAMQLFLDDTVNEWQPDNDGINENHAREMLELHFMGREDRYGNPNYTQIDVIALAHSLSGWRLNYWWVDGPAEGMQTLMNTRSALWSTAHWDFRVKTLFGKTSGFDTPQAIAHILDVCKAKVARHVCKKLYYEFVNHSVDEDVVDEMAQHLLDNGMNILPTLRMLLSSKHFYEPRHRMSLVQSPARFVLGLMRATHVEFVPDFDIQMHRGTPDLVVRMRDFGHSLGQPPSVSGWVSGPRWLSAPAVHRRLTFVDKFATNTIVAMDNDTGPFCHTFNVDGLMKSMQADYNGQKLASALCSFFLEDISATTTQSVYKILGNNSEGKEDVQREALRQVLRSFRAQLH